MGTVIHIHIPKTAGSSLNKILADNFDGKNRFSFHTPSSIRAFIFMTRQERQNIDLFFGHVHYGFVEFFGDNCVVVSVLREPISRIYSYYMYLCRNTEHPDYHLVGGKGLNFDEFLKTSSYMRNFRYAIDNYQVRALSGELNAIKADLRNNLKYSIENAAQSNNIIGIQEDFSKLLQRLIDVEIIKNAETVRKNTTGSSGSIEKGLRSLSSESRILLRKYVRWDDILYRTICDVYDFEGKEIDV